MKKKRCRECENLTKAFHCRAKMYINAKGYKNYRKAPAGGVCNAEVK